MLTQQLDQTVRIFAHPASDNLNCFLEVSIKTGKADGLNGKGSLLKIHHCIIETLSS